ncbi:hypothetical protein HaLaN_23745, partial [Haematococcus lacustris]
MWTPASTTLPC